MSMIERSQFDIPLSEISFEKIPSVGHETTLEEVVQKMQESKSGALPVLKGETAIGLISERDIVHKVDFKNKDCFKGPVSDYMTPGPFSLPKDSLVSDAMKLITRRGFRHIPITGEKGEFVSLLSIKDVLDFLIKFFPDHVTKYGTVKTWDFQTVDDYSESYSSELSDYSVVNGNIFLAHLKRISHKRPLLLDYECSIGEVIDLMRSHHYGTVLLMRYETELRGVITERDLMFKVFQKENLHEELKARDFMTPKPDTLLRKHYIAHAINNMFQFKYRNTIVVDEDHYPLSVISILEVFKFITYHFYGDELKVL